MSSVDILRDALFGNPPSPTFKPSREGVLAAITTLKLTTEAGIAAAALSGTSLTAAMALVAPLLQSSLAAQAALEAALQAIPASVADQLQAAIEAATAEANAASADAADSRDAAQLAAATALASSRYFPSRSAGEAASTTGQLFSTDDGAGNLIYYRRTAGGSTEISRALTPASLSAPGAAALIGYDPPGTLSQPRTVQDKLSELYISVADKMTPEQIAAWKAGLDTYAAENWVSVQTCINEAKDAGGGTVVFTIPAERDAQNIIIGGVLWVDQPIEGESYVALEGVSRNCVIRKKGNVPSNTTNVDCIINIFGKREFSITRLMLIGDRVKVGGVDQGTQHGLHTKGSYDAVLSEVTVDYCLDGFQFSLGNNIVGLNLMAIRCSGYAFRLFGSQTTTTLISPVAWGCAGAYSLVTAPYNTIIASAADLISVGNRPANLGGDPFGDAGGDYLHPKYIFELIGSPTSILNPGTENSCAMWLYAEGTQSTILSPFVENMQAHTADWVFAQLRGPNPTHVTLLNPSWRNTILNIKGAGPRAFVVEAPEAQQFEPSGRWRIDSITAPGAYSGRGISASGSRELLSLTQSSMVPGQDAPFLKADVSDTAKIIVESGVKKLQVAAVSAASVKFDLPLAGEGLFNVIADASYTSSAGPAMLAIVSIASNNAETVVRSWSNDGSVIAVSDWIYAAAPSGGRLVFRVTTNATSDVLKFTNLAIVCSPRQQ